MSVCIRAEQMETQKHVFSRREGNETEIENRQRKNVNEEKSENGITSATQ